MAKKDLIRDVFVKFDRYYKDLYLINYQCFCGGVETERQTKGFFFGLLNDLETKLIKTEFQKEKDSSILFVSDVKKAKDDLLTYVKEVENDSDVEEIKNRFSILYEEVRNKDTWLPLPFTDEEIEKLITDADTVEFDVGDPTIRPLVITKTLFPSISLKNIEKVQYVWNRTDDLLYLYFRYPAEYFTLFLRYSFLVEPM